MTHGIHHITAISSDPQRTFDFYSYILGLRLVKKTVNQDDRGTYHLFFGDEVGSPGMDLTFFPYANARPGTSGEGMVSKIMLAVKAGSLDFWQDRFANYEIKHEKADVNILGDKYINFWDWDGQSLCLVETDNINVEAKVHVTSEIDGDKAINNFYGAQIDLIELEPTLNVLTKQMGFKVIEESATFTVLKNQSASFANVIFLQQKDKIGAPGAGTVHHIAFRMPDEASQQKLRDQIVSVGLHPTETIDRFYFKSVYFREPGGVLFELATDEPGFTADESAEGLGEHLSLPPFVEPQRNQIERTLAKLVKPNKSVLAKSKMLARFAHIFIDRQAKHTLFLLHGTGADERDLLQILNREIYDNYNIVSLRGNVSENGMLRFFMRYGPGDYDQESIKTEADKLHEFVQLYCEYSKQAVSDITFLGYSNGANMVFAAAMYYPEAFNKMILLHPAMVLPKDFPTVRFDSAKALVTYGKHDEMITMAESLEVVNILKKSGAQVTQYDNMGGHGITSAELDEVYAWLQN